MALVFRALVIDDSAHMRILLARFLKHLGFQFIETAESGKIGLEKFASFKPQMVFLDSMMPEVDGMKVLHAIRSQSPEAIVIIVSSLSDREKVLQFKESGADFYLVKPFEEAKFREAAQKAISILEDRQKESNSSQAM